jgi:hypothetical protein
MKENILESDYSYLTFEWITETEDIKTQM